MATFLVAHGAWTAGWAWKKMHPLLRAAGHRLVTPTLTGLGERAHLATPDVNLDTHVQDMLGVLNYDDLADVILIGDSYGGMVGTGVADRSRERIAQAVYLDAFVPADGQSLFDLHPAEAQAHFREQAKSAGEGWRVPPMAMPADTIGVARLRYRPRTKVTAAWHAELQAQYADYRDRYRALIDGAEPAAGSAWIRRQAAE